MAMFEVLGPPKVFWGDWLVFTALVCLIHSWGSFETGLTLACHVPGVQIVGTCVQM